MMTADAAQVFVELHAPFHLFFILTGTGRVVQGSRLAGAERLQVGNQVGYIARFTRQHDLRHRNFVAYIACGSLIQRLSHLALRRSPTVVSEGRSSFSSGMATAVETP